MQNMKIVIYFLLIIHTLSFESEDTLKARLNYYQRISALSNNTLAVGFGEEKGLKCIASDYIEAGQVILRIPKRFSLCPYNLFPFKYELFNYLKELPGMMESIGKEHRLSTFLLTYYILYYLHAPKEDIKNYIKEKKLSHYYDIDEVDESMKDSFPAYIMNLQPEHFMLLKGLGYPHALESELDNVFHNVKEKIYLSPHLDMLLPWTTNSKKFKIAFFLASSRGNTVKFEDYNLMEDNKNMTKWSKKNQEVNKFFSRNIGSNCLVSYVDLCNHYQPRFEDLRDKKTFYLYTSPQYFLVTVDSKYRQGEEVTYTYSPDSSNLMIFYKYGLAVYPNIFNLAKLRVDDHNPININQFNLCKELGCIESFHKDPMKLPKTKEYSLRYSTLDDTLINYARVKFLKGNFDSKQIIKLLANKQSISFENEVSAWLFYLNSCEKIIIEQNVFLENIFYEIQNFRNLQREIEKEWKNKDIQKEEWTKFKVYENIYLMDLSYKIIIQRHLKGSINNIIANTHQELQNIKAKYL